MNVRPALLFSLLLFASPWQAQAATRTLSADSKIVSVTVFADRAQVTRSATVSLEPGSNLVTFEGLPLLVVEDSLRVEGKGGGRARIAGITVKSVFLDRIPAKRVNELVEEIAALNRKLESIEARRSALASQRAFIDSIRVGWGERISKELGGAKPSSADLGEAVKFVGEGIDKVEEQLYDTEAAKKPLSDRIAALKKELEQNSGNGKKELRSVTVAIEAERGMQFALDLSYLVSQASWEPSYDVRLAADGKEAELVYRAQVRQQTGEDWSKVKLALSSATPEIGGAPPELTPWRISFYEPPRPVAYAPRKAAKSAMMPMAASAPLMQPEVSIRAVDEQMAEAPPILAEVAEGRTSVLFNISEPVTIPADGTRSGSVIAVEKVPVTAEYLAVPKLSPHAYLKSQVTNKTPYPLLAGEANVFNDQIYSGKNRLKGISSGEKFDLFFGVDDQVKVKRQVDRVSKKAGMLSGNSIDYRVTMELENFKKTAVILSLIDQLPLAANAEIKIGLDEANPRPDETRPDGTLVWKVKLAAGEKKKIGYGIGIDYPKGRELYGAE